MDIYFTSKNTGPTFGTDPLSLVYVGTDLDAAVAAVGKFSQYEKPLTELNFKYPEIRAALPKDLPRLYMRYYMADGWWYTVAKVSF